MSLIIDCIENIGFDVVRDRIKSVSEEKAIRKRLKSFLERQARINEVCSRDEEIDFEGLANYIQDSMIEDVKDRLYGDKGTRARARTAIRGKAVAYSRASTRLSTQRAIQMAETSIDILKAFYRGRTNRDLRFITAEIEDTVSAVTDEQTATLLNRIDQAERNIGESNLLSLDSNFALAKAGKLSIVEDNLSSFMKGISAAHTLFPHYGFALENSDKLISIPLSSEAVKLYPPRFDITVSSVRLGDTFVDQIDSDVLSRSYRHQIPIEIDVDTVEKYLGNILDPSQHEAEKLAGSHVVVTPPPLPPAFPCSFSVDGVTYFDYVLLRTKEILDDGTAIITNEEQPNRPYDIQLIYNHQHKQFSFNIHLLSPSNAELLRYNKFVTYAERGGEIQIKALKLNEVFVKGPANRTGTEVTDLSKEIQFLEMIVKIEDCYQCQINLPKVITRDEYDTINHLYILLTEGEFKGNWTKMDFEFIVSQQTKQRVSDLIEATYTLWYYCQAEIDVFGQTLLLPMRRRIEGAQVFELEKIKRKAEVLDEGDSLKIKYIPGSGKATGVYYDYIGSSDDNTSIVYARIEHPEKGESVSE